MTPVGALILRYWETLRHLRPEQLFGRLWFRLHRPRPVLGPPPGTRGRPGIWVRPAVHATTLVGPDKFRLLNEVRSLADVGWDAPDVPKLWRYNLHYFDDLTAADATRRTAWHRALIDRWIAENPAGRGTGWEPYPTSLRIVNWIKWTLAGNSLTEQQAASLATQVRWLARRIEFHLLGNHLFANAKALVFAGSYFEGEEADGWRRRGLDILARELPEQVLPDGAQFELSPMYHALALEDLLDVVNVSRATATDLHPSWDQQISAMLTWLAAMVHPDGEISFFNDAAQGIAPPLTELRRYARELGYHPQALPLDRGCLALKHSGYVRLESQGAVALLDVGRIGPDYLPGHAHADTLSFELSVGRSRAIVNSGTSLYAPGPERLRQRGTAAHSTVAIEGCDSSEVWSSFRVARRAHPHGLSMRPLQDGWKVECSHDGYRWLPGRPRHNRIWEMRDKSLTVADKVSGPPVGAMALFHLHPALTIELVTATTGNIRAKDDILLRWTVESGAPRIGEGSWHPAFGVSMPNLRLVVDLVDNTSIVHFAWGKA